jgi:pyruvate/2-oxoglutarate dehydrogenase complex dihydrolipoamide dehydrogenase (E3) component
MAERRFDLVAIGGGSAGLGAVRAAAKEGLSAALISDGPLGGDCTFTGCVPSKALLAASAQGADFVQAMQHVQSVIREVAALENAEVLTAEGVTVIAQRATFVDSSTLQVGDDTVVANNIVVATGARPVAPPVPGLDDVGYLTNETLFQLDEKPSHLLIVGGGPIGCEMATAFVRLGVAVTVVEVAPRIMNRDDADAAAVVHSSLVDLGVTIHTGAAITAFRADLGGIVAVVNDEEIVGSHVLVAAGRKANTSGFGLEALGVALKPNGCIDVRPTMASSIKGIWGAGDVTGEHPFSHSADEMGRLAAQNSAKRLRRRSFVATEVPYGTFTTPEVAQVGLTEEQAPAGSRIALSTFADSDRGMAANERTGFVKLIAGPRRVLGWTGGGKLIGATIVHERAGEMIHEPALIIANNMFPGRMAQLVHAYPTWSIAIRKAASMFYVEVDGKKCRTKS